MPRDSRRRRGGEVEAGYTRTTITVPDDLKRRMRRAAEPVNWSAVACQAFARRLEELELKQKEQNLIDFPSEDEALARLRNARSLPIPGSAGAAPSRAWQLGRRWAMADAHPSELERLEPLARKYGLDQREQLPQAAWERSPREARRDKIMLRDFTAELIGLDDTADIDLRRERSRWFWQSRVCGGRKQQLLREQEIAPFLHGFVGGALDFWRVARERI